MLREPRLGAWYMQGDNFFKKINFNIIKLILNVEHQYDIKCIHTYIHTYVFQFAMP